MNDSHQEVPHLRNNPYKVAIASMVGTAIEFYDYYIYAAAAVLVFNTQFFDKSDEHVAVLLSLSTLALAFLAVRASSSASAAIRGGYELTANFDNIGGLKTRAAVRSAGVVVGRVTDITLDPQTYQAHVTMQMDSRFHFPKDSSLKIMTAGLLGEQYPVSYTHLTLPTSDLV